MCLSCWEDYGSHKLRSDKIKNAVDAINKVYEYSLVGGNLHIVVDDWNIEDHNLLFCEKEISKEEDKEQRDVEQECFDILFSMTIEERNSTLYWQWEGWDSVQ